MSESKLIDTFPAFLAFWEKAQHQSIDAQIQGWASTYLAQWPELLEKQILAYSEEGDDWRQVASERVIPFWSERLPSMRRAHQNLLKVCKPVYKRAQEALGFQQALTFVIYVGIGCGAGWATTYQDNRAILFGLENIAEEGWDGAAVLNGLIGHEIGHLWHFDQRSGAGLPEKNGPWWQLYTEGLAQRCEFVIAGRDSWHMGSQSDEWLRWCRRQKGWLAREFLRVVEEGDDIRIFFGSWCDVRGHKQTGYFLGHEAVRRLEEQMTLAEIARIKDVEAVFSDVVKAIAQEVTG